MPRGPRGCCRLAAAAARRRHRPAATAPPPPPAAQVAEVHAAALAEDASIFDYDSHYDSIQEVRLAQSCHAAWLCAQPPLCSGWRVKCGSSAPPHINANRLAPLPPCRPAQSPGSRRSCSASRGTSRGCSVRSAAAWPSPLRCRLVRCCTARAWHALGLVLVSGALWRAQALLCCCACASDRHSARHPAAVRLGAEKAEERKQEQDILYERQLAKERVAGEGAARCMPPTVPLSLRAAVSGAAVLPLPPHAVRPHLAAPPLRLPAPPAPRASRGSPVWGQGEVCDGGVPCQAGGAAGVAGGAEAQVGGPAPPSPCAALLPQAGQPGGCSEGQQAVPACSLVACQAGCMRAPGACTTGGPQPTAAPRALSPSVCRKAEEEANAVEKRGHMGDFYRNLLRSNVAFGSKAAADGKEAEKAAAAAAAGGEQRQPGPGGAAAAAQQEGQGQRRAVEPGQAQREQEEAMAAEAAKQRAQRGAAPAAAAPAAEQQQQQAGPPVVPAGAAASGSAAAEEGVPPAGAGAAEETAPATEAVQRRNKDDAVAAARERYLARKRQKTG